MRSGLRTVMACVGRRAPAWGIVAPARGCQRGTFAYRLRRARRAVCQRAGSAVRRRRMLYTAICIQDLPIRFRRRDRGRPRPMLERHGERKRKAATKVGAEARICDAVRAAILERRLAPGTKLQEIRARRVLRRVAHDRAAGAAHARARGHRRAARPPRRRGRAAVRGRRRARVRRAARDRGGGGRARGATRIDAGRDRRAAPARARRGGRLRARRPRRRAQALARVPSPARRRSAATRCSSAT